MEKYQTAETIVLREMTKNWNHTALKVLYINKEYKANLYI